jgi:hypothetical protein
LRRTRVSENEIEIDPPKGVIAAGRAPRRSQTAVGIVDAGKFAAIKIFERDDTIFDSARCDHFAAHKAHYLGIATVIAEELQKFASNHAGSTGDNGASSRVHRFSLWNTIRSLAINAGTS